VRFHRCRGSWLRSSPPVALGSRYLSFQCSYWVFIHPRYAIKLDNWVVFFRLPTTTTGTITPNQTVCVCFLLSHVNRTPKQSQKTHLQCNYSSSVKTKPQNRPKRDTRSVNTLPP
jgi:hypothetical protein